MPHAFTSCPPNRGNANINFVVDFLYICGVKEAELQIRVE